MEGKAIKGRAIRTIDIVQVGIMAALIFIGTRILYFPIGQKAVLHLGDTLVYTAAVLFGRKKAGISAAIGMSLFDLLSPYSIWAPFTFIIKGLMGFIAGLIAYRGGYKGNNVGNNILAFAIAGIWMIAGYFFAGAFIYHSFALAVADIPGNIIQVVAGSVIALPLSKALKRANIK